MAYQPQIVGVPVWYLAAWTDSRTKAFSLTNAVWSQLPQQLACDQWSRRCALRNRPVSGWQVFPEK